MAYGLRVDFQGNLFEGSAALLAWADAMREVRTICHCGKKATMVIRRGPDGRAVKDGEQVQIVVAENHAGVVAECAHETQHAERIGPTVDEVADEPELVAVSRKSRRLQQVAQFVEAALEVADRYPRHDLSPRGRLR